MTKKEAKKFEKLLVAERTRLTSGLRRFEEENLYQPTSDNRSDLDKCAEVGTDAFERETALCIASNETEWLRDVEDALKRIDKGTYGDCEGCGNGIPKKRLEFFPGARYCIECQSKLERDGYL